MADFTEIEVQYESEAADGGGKTGAADGGGETGGDFCTRYPDAAGCKVTTTPPPSSDQTQTTTGGVDFCKTYPDDVRCITTTPITSPIYTPETTITPTPTTPPADWVPPPGSGVTTSDITLSDGFIIPKGSTIYEDGSALLPDGTWLPAGTVTANRVKYGNVPSMEGGGVNPLVIGVIVAGLGLAGYYWYLKNKSGGDL